MNQLVKILIVEDEELYALKLEALILELEYELVGTTDNSEDAVKLIINKRPDVVIMDININGKLNGIEVAKKLNHVRTSFLFITSLREKDLYKKAKQTSYIGYLIKPFDEVTLQSAIEFALSRQYNEKLAQEDFKGWVADFVIEDSVLIKHNAQLYKVFIADIFYIEAKGKLSILYTKDKKFISNTSLTKFLSTFPSNQFMRVHKSYIVNIKYIKKIILKNNEIFVNEQPLPIGRVYKQDILKGFDIF